MIHTPFRRPLLLAGAVSAAILTAGCSKEESAPEPPKPPASVRSTNPASAAPEMASKASEPPPAPPPVKPPRPAFEPAVKPPIPDPGPKPTQARAGSPEKGPQTGTTHDPAICSAAFTFRTMDHVEVEVFINGHRHESTSCLWSLTLNTAFDPKIPVTEWPPAGAAYGGAAKRHDEDGRYVSSIEIWIAGGSFPSAQFGKLLERCPHLVDGEHILFVKGDLKGRERCGALRVRLVAPDGAAYRWVDYTPVQSMEEENASRFARTLWFERGLQR